MNVIIPMTGYGSRFVNVGYKELKPMIKVSGRPIIEWIIQMFNPESDHFILVCRAEHFEKNMLDENYLSALAKNITVYKIKDWIKMGPVYDILKASSEIDDEEPCIVNYCDFYAPWDWSKASKSLLERKCDGAIICFTDFHPCLIPTKNVYASCLRDDEQNLIEIKEKYSFSKDKFKGYHSTGTYYFHNGKLLKKYYLKAVQNELKTNGEYYSSLPYNYMVEDGLKVWAPVLGDYFFTWGTPYDLEEFMFWTNEVKGWVK